MVQPYVIPECYRFSNAKNDIGKEAHVTGKTGDIEAQDAEKVEDGADNSCASSSGTTSPVHDAYLKLIGKGKLNLPQVNVDEEDPSRSSVLAFPAAQTPGQPFQQLVQEDPFTICPPGCFCHSYGCATEDRDDQIWWTTPIMIPETPTLEQPRPVSSTRMRSWTSDEVYQFAHGVSRSVPSRASDASTISRHSGQYVANSKFRFPSFPVSASLRRSVSCRMPPASVSSSLSAALASPSAITRPLPRSLSWHALALSGSAHNSLQAASSRAFPPSSAMTSSTSITEGVKPISAAEKLVQMSRQEYHSTEVAKWREELKRSEKSHGMLLEKSWGECIRKSVHIAEPKAVYVKPDNTSEAPRRALGDITNRKVVRITVPLVQHPNGVNAFEQEGIRRISS